MDSSPDLSVKLRRGSSDSRDSFYMGFAQGIDSDIEEVTTVQSAPPPPLYPPPEEPPIDIPITVEVLSEPEELRRLPDIVIEEDEELLFEELQFEEVIPEEVEQDEQPSASEEIPQELFEPPPPLMFDDDEDTNTSVTVIQSKNKTPSSSSSSISSAINELAADDVNRTSPPSPTDSPKSRQQSVESRQQSVEAEIVSTSPPSHRSTPSRKTSPSHKSHSSQKSPPVHKSPPSLKSSPPKRLNLYKEPRARNFDSDSIDSINEMNYKIDDDNRDDSSPTDSMPPGPTPPPLGFPLSLEKRWDGDFNWIALGSSISFSLREKSINWQVKAKANCKKKLLLMISIEIVDVSISPVRWISIKDRNKFLALFNTISIDFHSEMFTLHLEICAARKHSE